MRISRPVPPSRRSAFCRSGLTPRKYHAFESGDALIREIGDIRGQFLVREDRGPEGGFGHIRRAWRDMEISPYNAAPSDRPANRHHDVQAVRTHLHLEARGLGAGFAIGVNPAGSVALHEERVSAQTADRAHAIQAAVK